MVAASGAFFLGPPPRGCALPLLLLQSQPPLLHAPGFDVPGMLYVHVVFVLEGLVLRKRDARVLTSVAARSLPCGLGAEAPRERRPRQGACGILQQTPGHRAWAGPARRGRGRAEEGHGG